MHPIIRLPFVLFLLAAVALAAASCGPRTTNLSYDPIDIDAPACRGELTVLKFNDLTTGPIGEVANKEKVSSRKYVDAPKPVLAVTNVADWVSEAVVEQLQEAGCLVRYHPSLLSGSIKGLYVHGDVERAHYTKKGAIDYDSVLRLTVRLNEQGRTLFEKTYTSENSFTGSAASASGVMQEALHDLMRLIVPDVIEAAEAND